MSVAVESSRPDVCGVAKMSGLEDATATYERRRQPANV